MLDGFARGINYYIAEHRTNCADWIEPISAVDVEALERSQYLRFYSVHDALSKLTDLPYVFPSLWLEPVCDREDEIERTAELST